MTKLQALKASLRKAIATAIFAGGATMGLNEPLGMEVAQWKLALAVGLGAVANLVYRWAEKVIKEPEPRQVDRDDLRPDIGESVIWTIVGVLAAIALLIWIAPHFR